MAFTKALYYPRIQVPNEAWLKTAMLYWDEVKNHCSGINARALYGHGIPRAL